MKNGTILSLGLVLSIGITSCNDRELVTIEEHSSLPESLGEIVIPDTSRFLSNERAAQIAAAYCGNHLTSRASGRVVSSVKVIEDETGFPVMYVANYENNEGFLILSASKDYYPVLAESREGNFDAEILSSNHPVNIWLKENQFNIKHSDSLSDSIKNEIASLWMEYNLDRSEVFPYEWSRTGSFPDKPQSYYDSLRIWSMTRDVEVYTYEDYKLTEEYRRLSDEAKTNITTSLNINGNSLYGPIESSTLVVKSKTYDIFELDEDVNVNALRWQQEGGFNKFVPNRYPLGCTTVAVGQIMRYNKFPRHINWNLMRLSTPSEYTADFLYTLANSIGVVFDEGSSSGYDKNVSKVFKDYGYTVSEGNHNADRVVVSLKNGFPVYMSGFDDAGKGHAWMCNGVKHYASETLTRFMTVEYRPTLNHNPPMIEAYRLFPQRVKSDRFFI